MDRMPFGMIEHSINFFNADNIHQVQVVLPLSWMLQLCW